MRDLPHVRFTKGHGTENSFLVVADPGGTLQLTAAAVRRLCDPGAGIGADGVIRAAPASEAGYETGATWFMDYRNADGSLAEMCGNGIRVLVAFLRAEGLVEADGPYTIATRGGERTVWSTGPAGGMYTVDMGPYTLPGGAEARSAGFDVAVKLAQLEQRPGLRVLMPNPHTVMALGSSGALADLDLRDASYDPEPPDGTNLEVVVPLGETERADGTWGVAEMRVLERGSGETRSCGTGCCAVAVAMHEWGGPDSPSRWEVHVPGGVVDVELRGGRAFLTGPALLVADVLVYG